MLESIRDKFYSVDSQIVKEIKGHPAQSGIAQGVVFLHGPGVLQGKKIPDVPFIIVSASTHPDDLPIMKSAVAIVTDEGGILSHAAIVSRELKKPCIIGTKIATKVLKDGDLVEVDAEKGIVRIIEKAK
jgi:pyruvate,water dikinase